MKVQVVPSYRGSTNPWQRKQFTVQVSQGVQSFRLDYMETKKNCQWMAKMFRKALKAHDKEKAA